MTADVVSRKKKARPSSALFKKAIVALELSAPDYAILNWVDLLTEKQLVKTLHFLHVVPPMELYHGSDVNTLSYLLEWEDLRNRAHVDVNNRIAKHSSVGLLTTVTSDVRQGDPLEELLAESGKIKADLLILGKDTDKARHGIWSSKLVRQTTNNVLVVPDRSPATLRNILVPVDFSDNSAMALRAALSVAAKCEKKPTIKCLHIYTIPSMSWFKIQRQRSTMQSIFREDREEAMKAFLKKHTSKATVRVEPLLIEIESPSTGSYILDVAADNEGDLIVMGAKGHSRFERLLLGSVTENVLAHIQHQAVLVVREKVK